MAVLDAGDVKRCTVAWRSCRAAIGAAAHVTVGRDEVVDVVSAVQGVPVSAERPAAQLKVVWRMVGESGIPSLVARGREPC